MPDRSITNEITRADNGKIVVARWEWRNGWNLRAIRPARPDEIARFESGDGLPVPATWEDD